MRLLCLSILLAPFVQAQDFSSMMVERVAAGYIFTEGPAVDSRGTLLFSDVPSNRILRFTPGHGVTTFRENSGAANGNTYDDKGRLYTCEGGNRRVTRTDKDGKVEVLAERFEDKRFNAPNDITVRRDGHIYFTDPAFGNQQDTRELTFFGVYHLTPRGELSVIARLDKRPNGIALAPSGRILYVAGSDERAIRAWDLDRGGNATNPRLVVTGIEGVPDGIRVDSKGRIFVACDKVAIYSPEGKLIHQIPLPETPSNLEIVEQGEFMIYVTARRSVYRVRPAEKGAAPQE